MQGEPLPAASGGVGQLPGVDVYGQTEFHKSWEYNKNTSCDGIGNCWPTELTLRFPPFQNMN